MKTYKQKLREIEPELYRLKRLEKDYIEAMKNQRDLEIENSLLQDQVRETRWETSLLRRQVKSVMMKGAYIIPKDAKLPDKVKLALETEPGEIKEWKIPDVYRNH
jgi:predicted nuclease with TOPRIM domain